jgi:N-acetylglucosamine-6-phosphate deacetylase
MTDRALANSFVDIHCHGGGGHAFGGDVEGTLAALAAHRAHGTGKVVASLVSEPVSVTIAGMDVVRQAMAVDAAILGVHLEGPFISPARKGAHDLATLRLPTRDAVTELLEAGDGIIRQITIAPELDGALDAIEQLVEAGVVVAVGHSEADAATTCAAFDRGATLLTHGFNAMRGIVAREVGPVGAALADERVAIELIADGIHVDPSLVAAVFRAAPGRVVLVTDAMAAAASAPGRYPLGTLQVDVTEDGRAYVAGTQTLAGSTLTMDRAVEVCVAAGVPEADAVAAATTTPARVIGL